MNLSANKLGDKAAAAIGKNVKRTELKELDLSENEIGDYEANVIGQNTSWKNIIKFDIHSNSRITEKGRKELRENLIFGSFVNV